MQQPVRNPYWKIEHQIAQRLVRLVRTSVPFWSMGDLATSVAEVSGVLDKLGRKSFVLLVDLRDGPMRADPVFETAMATQRPRLLLDVPKIAILVQTALGSMQLSRHQRQGDIAWTVFNDEAAALEHLGRP